jgi:glycine cleavage system regulatory protein
MDLLTLLQQSILTVQADGAVIVENMRASNAMEADILAAIEARIRQEELREQYNQFCEDCKRDLDPIEAEYGGVPTFKEWKEAYAHA